MYIHFNIYLNNHRNYKHIEQKWSRSIFYFQVGAGGSLSIVDHRGNIVLHENAKPVVRAATEIIYLFYNLLNKCYVVCVTVFSVLIKLSIYIKHIRNTHIIKKSASRCIPHTFISSSGDRTYNEIEIQPVGFTATRCAAAP